MVPNIEWHSHDVQAWHKALYSHSLSPPFLWGRTVCTTETSTTGSHTCCQWDTKYFCTDGLIGVLQTLQLTQCSYYMYWMYCVYESYGNVNQEKQQFKVSLSHAPPRVDVANGTTEKVPMFHSMKSELTTGEVRRITVCKNKHWKEWHKSPPIRMVQKLRLNSARWRIGTSL